MTPLDDATAFFIDAIERPAGARVVPFEPWHLPLLIQREHEASSDFAAQERHPRAHANLPECT